MKFNDTVSKCMAECIGTFFLIFFGCGSIILFEINPNNAGPFIPVIWGTVVSVVIYTLGHVSGAHINPAVTVAFWAAKKFPGKKVPGYIASQILGAALASYSHLLIWGSSHQFGGTHLAVSVPGGFLIEVLLSFFLMFVVMGTAIDSRASQDLAGVAIGATVALAAFVGGPLTGASMNPARSIGPALLSGNDANLWLYIVAPILGTVLGAKVYGGIRAAPETPEEPPLDPS
ncbi:MAG: aquaporin [Bacteriovoracales bacterium]|nr:aquaporin [Bacteriovoracales bacterium]